MLLTAAAYVLMQELRLSAAGTNCARAQAWTLRERFLKLGARVSEPVQAKDVELKERTYFNYRDETVETLNTSDISRALASRYACEPVSIGDQVFPVTILWQNRNALIHPDEILGTLDYSKPEYLSSSPTLSVTEYALARTLIESIYTAGPIKH